MTDSAQENLATVAQLWTAVGLPADALNHLTLTGTTPVLPSSFAVSRAAQASIALAGLAAARFGYLRTGWQQRVTVDLRHAAIECRSDHYFTIDGRSLTINDPLTGLYRCAEGWVRIHANFAHHRAGAIALLGCEATRSGIAAALQGWDALAFEQRAAAQGLPVVALRTAQEWDASGQGMVLAGKPGVALSRIDDAPAAPVRRSADHPGTNDITATPPLAGVRVLELTRILAGPVCGRTLAAYGADVMLVNAPHLPNIDAIADTSRGKLSVHIDLRTSAGKAQLHALLESADVFIQAYRPLGIAGLGFSAEVLAARYPGLVYASLSAYGPDGPWQLRRGFDSLVQTAAGFNHAEAVAAGTEEPRPLPTQILDHASGHLLAFGIQAALIRRSLEGGSWHVQVSLAQTAQWLREMGRVPDGFSVPVPGHGEVQDLIEETASGFGVLGAVRHAARFSGLRAGWSRPSVPVGTHPPSWPSV